MAFDVAGPASARSCQHVDAAQTEAQLEALRRSVQRGAPYGRRIVEGVHRRGARPASHPSVARPPWRRNRRPSAKLDLSPFLPQASSDAAAQLSDTTADDQVDRVLADAEAQETYEYALALDADADADDTEVAEADAQSAIASIGFNDDFSVSMRSARHRFDAGGQRYCRGRDVDGPGRRRFGQ